MESNVFKKLIVLSFILLLAGCYKVRIENLSPGGGPGSEQKEYTHTLIGGLIPLGTVDASRLCGDKGVWNVATRMNGVSFIASFFTFGIYVPMQAVVTCKG